MARGVNKVILVGNCCSDPEIKYMPSGGAVTNITIACNNSYKDKKSGEIVDTTEFVRVVFFNRLAEIAGEYLRKGSQIYVEGSLRTRKWQDQSGQDRYTTEIVANDLQMLGSSQASTQQPKQQSAQPQQARQSPPAQPMGVHHDNRQQPAQQVAGFDSFDDGLDIPF